MFSLAYPLNMRQTTIPFFFFSNQKLKSCSGKRKNTKNRLNLSDTEQRIKTSAETTHVGSQLSPLRSQGLILSKPDLREKPSQDA